MRSVPLLSALLISVSSLALAAPQKAPLSMSDWHVAPVMSSGKTTASYCAMAARYDQGPIVTFTRNAANNGTIAIDFKNAALDKGKKYSVTTRINKKTHTFQAQAISKTQVLLNVGDDTTLYDELALGNPLTISLDGTAGVYALEGNVRAFFEFDHCLKALGPTVPEEAITAVKDEPVVSETIAPIVADKPVQTSPVFATEKPAEIKPATIAETAKPVVADAPMKLATPAELPKKVAPAPAPVAKADPTILWDALPPAPKKEIKTEKIAAVPVEPPVIDVPKVEKQKLAEIKSEDMPDVISAPVEKEKIAPIAAPVVEPIAASVEKKIETPVEKPVIADKKIEEKSRLKSTLAQARAEAATIKEPAPIVAAPVAAPTPPPAPRETITSARAPAQPSEIQGLIFDNENVKASAHAPTITPAKLEKVKPTTPPAVEVKPLPPTARPPAPTPPPAPVAPQESFDNTPILQDEIPALPAAMPKPILSVSAEPQPGQLNTVIPSVGQPASSPLPPVIPAPIAMPHKVITFRPAPAAPVATWRVQTIASTSNKPEDAFCLVENKYANDSILMIGQRADGFSTLGVNYGIDMLQVDRDYHVTVQVDGEFEEDFSAYAENPHTLVVQLGKKASFFDTLTGANGLRVAMPGTASSFDISNLPQSLNEFSDCVVKLGGKAIAVNSFIPDVAAVPVAKVTESALIASTMPKPVPVPPMAAPVAMPAPVPAPVVAAAPPVVAPAPAPIVAAKPEIIFDQPAEASAPPPAPIAIAPVVAKPTWAQNTEAFLFATGLAAVSPDKDAKQVSWHQSGINASANAMPEKDILDAATAALDVAERQCDGTFSSQIGLPENSGDSELQLMESKCDARNNVRVTTWLMEKRNGVVTSWSFEAPREQRADAFAVREAVQNALKDDTNISQNNTQDKNS